MHHPWHHHADESTWHHHARRCVRDNVEREARPASRLLALLEPDFSVFVPSSDHHCPRMTVDYFCGEIGPQTPV